MVVSSILDTRKSNKSGAFPVKLRFTEGNKTLYHSLGITSIREEFDTSTGMFIVSNRTTKQINNHNNQIILANIKKANDIIFEFDRDNIYLSVEKLKTLFLPQKEEKKSLPVSAPVVTETPVETSSFNSYFRSFIQDKKGRTAEIYQATLNKIEKYNQTDSTSFESITYKWLLGFDNFMSTELIVSPKEKRTINGLSVNARSIHFRNIRAVFNNAIDNEVIPLSLYPFRKFKIKKEDTIKRAMKLDDIQKLFQHSGSDQENWAIDMAKIIFFSVGINTKDLYNLSNISDVISYRRAKTGRLYNIFIEPELEDLLNKYKGEDGLIFKEQFQIYTSFSRKINEYLDKSCMAIGISTITTYAIRHTWATIASKLDIPDKTIAMALGHGKRTVTDTYIDFDMEKVKVANRKVIDYVLGIQNKKKKGGVS